MSFILMRSFKTEQDAMSFIAKSSLGTEDLIGIHTGAFNERVLTYVASTVVYDGFYIVYGTVPIEHTPDKASLALPATVAIETKEGLILDATVTWDKAGSTYDADEPLEQTITVKATVTLPSGVTNVAGLTLECNYNFKVKAENLLSVSFVGPATVTGIHNGMSLETLLSYYLNVPADITTTGNTVSASVAVDSGYVIDYDPSVLTEQTFTVKTHVVLPTGITNLSSIVLTRDITVTVDAQESLVSVVAPTAITNLANGTAKTAVALKLEDFYPEIVTDGITTSTTDVAIWDVAGCSYDPLVTTEQTFDVTGTIVLPAWVINPEEVSLSITVSVTVLAVA